MGLLSLCRALTAFREQIMCTPTFSFEGVTMSAQLMKAMELDAASLSEQETQDGLKLRRVVNVLQIRTLALDSLLALFEMAD